MPTNGRYTNSDVKELKGHTTYALGHNLRVRERRNGRKFYVFIYRARLGPRRGKKITLIYGPTDEIDIKDAYAWANEQNLLIHQEVDPRAAKIAKRQANQIAALKSKTLIEVVEEYVAERSDPDGRKPWGRWTIKNMGYALNILKRSDLASFVTIRKMLVANIKPIHVAAVLNDYGQDAPTMANRFRDLIYGAMDLARDQGCYEGENPADPKGPLKRLIRIKHTSKQHSGWHFDELPGLWNLLCVAETDCKRDGLFTTAQAAKAIGRDRAAVLNFIRRGLLPAKQANFGKTATYLVDPADLQKLVPIVNANAETNFNEAHLAIPVLKFLLMTGVRFSEANEIVVDEVDWRTRVWTCPPERTKPGREHVVPLNDPAFEILEKMRARRDPSVPYLFAHGHTLTGADFHFGKPLCGGAVLKHLRRVSGDPTITIHSFRRGVGSWAESQFVATTRVYDTKIRRAVLGHAVSNGLDHIYGADATYEQPCRILLNDWADYLMHGPSEPSQSAEIVSLSARRIANA
jgi:integrase